MAWFLVSCLTDGAAALPEPNRCWNVGCNCGTYRSGDPALGLIGVLLLCALRISSGGEIGAINSYITEIAPLESQALGGSLIAGGCALFLANLVVTVLTTTLANEEMIDW